MSHMHLKYPPAGRQLPQSVRARPRGARPLQRARSPSQPTTPDQVSLITDGDIAGVIRTADPDNTGIDLYMGIGGTPEGVLAAAALSCIGGQMQTRLVLDKTEARARVAEMGIDNPRKTYDIGDMVSAAIACLRPPE